MGRSATEFIERIELQPIDAQANGPQLFFGLRYHTRILQPAEAATFHDQVGYWLWEPATGPILQTLAIPRGQVALAGRPCGGGGQGVLQLSAERGSTSFGIDLGAVSEYAFSLIAIGFRRGQRRRNLVLR